MRAIPLTLTITITSFAAFLCGVVSSPLQDSIAAQVERFAHVQAESFTLTKGGKVRGTLWVDHQGSALLQLRDITGNRNGLTLQVDKYGNPALLNQRGEALSFGKKNLPPVNLSQATGSGTGKADAATLKDVKVVRSELDAIWRNLKTLRDRVNELSQ